MADTYGVLADLDQTEDFLKAVAAAKRDDSRVHRYRRRPPVRGGRLGLPDGVEPVRLYEAYLRNFEIESGRSCVKFTLKDYQAERSTRSSTNLERARDMYTTRPAENVLLADRDDGRWQDGHGGRSDRGAVLGQ